eukprot:2202482-Pyramimonas_sp.AAC.1
MCEGAAAEPNPELRVDSARLDGASLDLVSKALRDSFDALPPVAQLQHRDSVDQAIVYLADVADKLRGNT